MVETLNKIKRLLAKKNKLTMEDYLWSEIRVLLTEHQKFVINK
jgi:hypothetical protein